MPTAPTPDRLQQFDVIPGLDRDVLHVGVLRHQASVPVLDFDGAVAKVDGVDRAARRREHGSACIIPSRLVEVDAIGHDAAGGWNHILAVRPAVV